MRFQIQPPSNLTFVGSPRVSPDGRLVAFFGTDEAGVTSIWVRPFDNLEARPLPGTETTMDTRPFWSPDSRHLAFFAGGKLKKIAIDGGPPQSVCDAPNGADGTWGSSGKILYDGAGSDPIHGVDAGGGIPKPVVEVDREAGETSAAWPEFLPDGRHFLYQVSLGGGDKKIMLGELDSDEADFVVDVDSRVQYVEPGYLLYVREDTLVAQPFDARAGEIAGEPRPLADQVGASSVGLADFSASHDRTLVYRSEVGFDVRQLMWRDRAGQDLEAVGRADMYGALSLSPDGRRLAVDVYDPQAEHRDLRVHDLERGTASRLTFDPRFDTNPVFSPDGSRIVFSSNRAGSYDLFSKQASGAGEVDELLTAEEDLYPCDWTDDGRFLVYMKAEASNAFDIWALRLDGSGDPFPVVQSQFSDVRPVFSPDGRWLAYESDESGRPEIYVRPFPGPGGKWQVSTDGGIEPHWSAGGREIVYLDPTQHLVAVAVEAGETFSAGIPEPLFRARLYQRTQRNRYVVSADGQRFLMLSPMESQSQPPTTVVLNWDASLER